jgi:hypothetical protein
VDLGLVDGSLICARGGDWRLHARYDPARSRFGDLALTSAREAEQTARIRIQGGQLIVNDQDRLALVAAAQRTRRGA